MNKDLLKELLDLPPAERMEIAERLWDSLEPGDMPPLTPEQQQEIGRRMEEHQKDPSSAVPWDEVLARLRSRVK